MINKPVIKKCYCGFFHIYKSFLPFMPKRAIQYEYRELFASAWVNRSFDNEQLAKDYISGLYKGTEFYLEGEFQTGVMESLCQDRGLDATKEIRR